MSAPTTTSTIETQTPSTETQRAAGQVDHLQRQRDGAQASYTIAQIEAASRARHLDDAQRLAWALIARRAREAVR